MKTSRSSGRRCRPRWRAIWNRSSVCSRRTVGPWRLHATYNETITHALNVFEKVSRDIPFDGLHWFIDHAETIDDRNIERIAKLGGGIAVQHCMAYQGEYFVERYGQRAAERTPPIRRMLDMGVPVGAGTDA